MTQNLIEHDYEKHLLNRQSEKYQPKTVKDLIIQKKKVAEVEYCLKKFNDYNILILSGPSGCGKKILLDTLFKKLGYSALYLNNKSNFEYDICNNTIINTQQQFRKSLKFSKYPRLLQKENGNDSCNFSKKVVLIKQIFTDGGNTVRNKQDDIIKEYIEKKLPYFIIFIITNIINPNDIYKVFSLKILSSKYVKHISINRFTEKTIIKKLTYITEKENLCFPISLLSYIAKEANGDLRSSIDLAQFNSIKIDNSLFNNKENSLNLTLFHLIGKILNIKRCSYGLQYSNLFNQLFLYDSGLILDYLQHNSIKYSNFNQIFLLDKIFESYCLSDMLISKSKQETYGNCTFSGINEISIFVMCFGYLSRHKNIIGAKKWTPLHKSFNFISDQIYRKRNLIKHNLLISKYNFFNDKIFFTELIPYTLNINLMANQELNEQIGMFSKYSLKREIISLDNLYN